ncbi:hypothetical protein [Herbaspirillum robiniae]|uniref:hypothetical protein n=1 Tax=Herbaspirillum robiniae TaxID=2014887 RepID=UPI001C30B978|nr:hypothetical protein [Herbaspirillum robiniae]
MRVVHVARFYCFSLGAAIRLQRLQKKYFDDFSPRPVTGRRASANSLADRRNGNNAPDRRRRSHPLSTT